MVDFLYERLLQKTIEAHQSKSTWETLVEPDKVAVALALNRADWLCEIDYTLAEALVRLGPVRVAMIPGLVHQLYAGVVTAVQ